MLIRPDFRGLTHPPDMPIGLLYVAAAVEKAGYDLRVLDLNRQELVDLTEFDVVCFSMLPLARKNTWEMIEELKVKKPEIKIVLGGVFPSSMPIYLLNAYPIDAIVVGEGEETMVDLLNHWKEGKEIKDVKGIATKKYGLHKKRELMDINKLGFPAWHYSNVDWFEMVFAVNHPNFECNGYILNNEKMIMLSASRGCPNFIKPCSFCDSPRFWQYRYRIRDSKLVLDEVETIYKRYGVRVFSFNDDAFPVSKKQCMEFCQGLKERELRIAWKSDTRADVIDMEMAKAMKESGCFMVALGVESGSNKILNNIHKNLDLNKARETIKTLKKVGIIAYVLLMVGNVGETEETIMETKKFLEETRPDIFTWVQGVMICPGTELDILAKKQDLIEDSYWTKKTNGMPIYHRELTMEKIQEFAGILSSVSQRKIE